MKKILLIFPVIALFSLVTLTQGCKKELPEDQLPEACNTLDLSYNAEIKAIIDASCAYSGCHIGADAPGDFSTYAGMKPSLDDGSVFDRVINEKDNEPKRMPPAYAPAGSPKELTSDQLDMMHCWIADGYPES